jgi:hypothetical protein
VQQLIRNDGGSGDYQEITPDMLGIWNTVLNVSGNTGPWEGAAGGGGQAAAVGSRLWAVGAGLLAWLPCSRWQRHVGFGAPF